MSVHAKLRGLYAITDTHLIPRERFAETVEAAVRGYARAAGEDEEKNNRQQATGNRGNRQPATVGIGLAPHRPSSSSSSRPIARGAIAFGRSRWTAVSKRN